MRFVPRFVPDAEMPAYFRRADVVALPYREIEQSGVLYTALAFGSPLLLSAVGGFPEIAERAARRGWSSRAASSPCAPALVELLDDDRAPRGCGGRTPSSRAARSPGSARPS